MRIEELANISHIKIETVKRRVTEIPGVENRGGEYYFPPGSRYPYDAHRYTFDSIDKRRIALLDAVSKFRYVDANVLQMEETSFINMMRELENAGYLTRNGSDNPYGANQYDTTLQYAQDSSLNKKLFKQSIVNRISAAAGHFIGGVINEVNS